MRLFAAALALCALVATAAAQAADPAGDAFRAATRQLADGELEAAQAAFEAVVALDPQGPWADDALSEAAGAAERRGDLAAARRLWRRVLDEHPASRQSRRARARVEAIEQGIGAGGEWLAVAESHEEILRAAVGKKDPAAEVAALEELVAANPEYPRAHEARMWIGDAWMRLGRPGVAARRFAAARDLASRPEDRWRAAKAHGDALAMDGDLDGAERVYRGLFGQSDDLSDRALVEALDDLAKMRLRARLTLGAWLVLLAGLLGALVAAWRVAGGVRPALRALVRPPIEVWFFLPVAAVISGVALSGNFLVEIAVREILLGGLAVTWLGGVTLELARRRGRLSLPVILVSVLTSTAAIASICYLAVMNDQLIDMLAETWHHGHDR